jgi:hypothetical protein
MPMNDAMLELHPLTTGSIFNKAPLAFNAVELEPGLIPAESTENLSRTSSRIAIAMELWSQELIRFTEQFLSPSRTTAHLREAVRITTRRPVSLWGGARHPQRRYVFATIKAPSLVATALGFRPFARLVNRHTRAAPSRLGFDDSRRWMIATS